MQSWLIFLSFFQSGVSKHALSSSSAASSSLHWPVMWVTLTFSASVKYWLETGKRESEHEPHCDLFRGASRLFLAEAGALTYGGCIGLSAAISLGVRERSCCLNVSCCCFCGPTQRTGCAASLRLLRHNTLWHLMTACHSFRRRRVRASCVRRRRGSGNVCPKSILSILVKLALLS